MVPLVIYGKFMIEPLPMKVIKIGGGCLKNGKVSRKIAQLISQRGQGDIFVLSAFYGVTNILLEGIEKALEDETNIPAVMADLQELHKTIIHELISDKKDIDRLSDDLIRVWQKLERYYYGVSYTREATPRMKDMIATTGERLSTIIMTKALTCLGQDAEALMPEKAGIISDGLFMEATAVMDKTRENLTTATTAIMTPEKILFIPGFYGVSETGEITTFGRGGSDYSAAVIAASVNAVSLEIWKDTEGFMTADPDNIPWAKLIFELTYEEAAELAYTGAGILHPRTVEPVKQADIVIEIKNTFNPDAKGSLIKNDAFRPDSTVKSVSYTTDVSVLKIYATGVGARYGVLSKITDRLANHNINIKSVVTSQTCISLLLSKRDLEKSLGIIKRIDPSPFRELSANKEVALVSIVGEGLTHNRGIAAKCFSAVSAADVNIEMISFGASDAALYFLVNEKALDRTIKALHSIFFD